MKQTIFLIAFLLTSSVLAEQPKATISGPTGGVAGDIIVLDATQSVGKFKKWMVTPKLQNGRQTIMEIENGARAIIASVPGQYSVTLIVSSEDGIDVIEYAVTIGGGPQPQPSPPQPLPPPGPSPAPINPEPTFPNEVFGMSTFSNKAAKQIPVNRQALLPDLAKAFKRVGGAAAEGGYDSLMEVELASTDANRRALYGDAAPTSPDATAIRNDLLPFFKALQPRIQELKMSQASTPALYGKMLIEIAVGLEKAK